MSSAFWEIIGGAAGVVGTVFLGFIGRQVQSELKDWTPKATETLVNRAVCWLPEEKRERAREEWAAHLNDTPGQVWKWRVALGCMIAAKRMSPKRERTPAKNRLLYRVWTAFMMFNDFHMAAVKEHMKSGKSPFLVGVHLGREQRERLSEAVTEIIQVLKRRDNA